MRNIVKLFWAWLRRVSKAGPGERLLFITFVCFFVGTSILFFTFPEGAETTQYGSEKFGPPSGFRRLSALRRFRAPMTLTWLQRQSHGDSSRQKSARDGVVRESIKESSISFLRAFLG